MGGVIPRPANVADADAIGALHVAAWRETYTGILPDEMLSALSVEARRTMWRNVLSDPAARASTSVFVAEDGGQIIGFGACSGQRDATLIETGFGGEIGALYVLGAHQGRGVGRTLVSALSIALIDLGHAAASLWVLRDNHRARRFYEMLGGEIVGEQTEQHPDGDLVEVAYGWRDLGRLSR